MGVPDLRLLASAGSRPQLNVIELATGEVTPSPVPVDNTFAMISGCTARDGWLAIDASGDVWGAPLPLQGRAFKVADAFTCLPAARGRNVWTKPGSESHHRLLEFDGVTRSVVREVEFSTPVRVYADVGFGLVGRDWSKPVWPTGDLYLYDYEGRRGDLVTADGDVENSRGARLLVRSGTGELQLIDLEAGHRTPIETPPSAEWHLLRPAFSPDGSKLALPFEPVDPGRAALLEQVDQIESEFSDRSNEPGALLEELDRRIPGWRDVVLRSSRPHRLAIVDTSDGSITIPNGEFENFAFELVWSADGRSLVFSTPFDERCLWLWQVGDEALERIPFKRSMPSPLLDVSDESVFGDLSVSTLRSIQRPRWRGPIPAEERERILRASRAQVEAAAEEAGLPAEALADSCREAIRIRSCVAGRSVPVGTSRLGGRPDLPPGYRWPLYDGDPMTFLGQLRIEELRAAMPSAPLPQDGLLVAFVAIEADGTYVPEEDCVHVAIVPERDLKRRAWPAKLDPELRYEHALAVAEPLYSPPGRAELLRDYAEDIVERFESACAPAGPNHQLFGHPRTIQQTRAPDDFRLLFEFDGDALLGAEFGDGGRIYVWCPDSDDGFDPDDCLVDEDSY